MARYRLAVFDSDGTLVDSLPWFTGVFNEVASQHGIQPVTAEEQAELRHLAGRELLRRMNIPIWKLPSLMTAMRRRMTAHAGEFRTFEGIPESLRCLAAGGVLLGIVSSNSDENVRRILGPELVGLMTHFHCGASMFGKPAMLKKLLKAAGVPAQESIYIGDELRDAEAAAKVGMAYGAVGWGYHDLDRLRATAALAFHDPADIARKILTIGPA